MQTESSGISSQPKNNISLSYDTFQEIKNGIMNLQQKQNTKTPLLKQRKKLKHQKNQKMNKLITMRKSM